MSIKVGTAFAGYTILKLLGSGGMAEVYLAQHPRLPRRDALKVLFDAMTAETDFRERFHREADLAATLWHPNIVGVHDRGEFDDHLWIAMNYVEGTDAASLVKNHYPAGMPIPDVCAIVTAVADALDYAHNRGLLHRDVKPANILLTEPEDSKRRVLLADFGIARPLADISGLTATNFTVGTLAYAAPEQLMGADIDGRADQYALAATAFHLLTGSPPYQHSNPVAVISQHLNAAPPKLSDQRPELEHLDHVLSTALTKDPTHRFDRCRDFATTLSERAAVDAESDRATEAGPTVAAAAAGSKTPTAVGRPRTKAAQSGQHDAIPQPTAKKAPPQPKESLPSGSEPRKTTLKRAKWRRRPAMMLAVVLVVFAAIAVMVYAVVAKNRHTPSNPSASKPAQPSTLLDGAYRLDTYDSKQTQNGAPEPGPDSTTWWAFRSSCGFTGCIATATRLNDDSHQLAFTPRETLTFRFADGHWQAVPAQHQRPQRHCLGANGKIVAGENTVTVTSSLAPQPDRTFRGIFTETILTNECGMQGAVGQAPTMAVRVGDVPADVIVDNPATVPPVPAPPAPIYGGPTLNGVYRLDYHYAKQTVNGIPDPVNPTPATYWWAFNSFCGSSGCAATGSELTGAEHQQPTGIAMALHWVDGDHWRGPPTIQPPAVTQCSSGTASDTETFSWLLTPQPDGTLRGSTTQAFLTNECGNGGLIRKVPMTLTQMRTDTPSGVVLADPALFIDPGLFKFPKDPSVAGGG